MDRAGCAAEAAAYQLMAFGNQRAVPQRSVLVGEQDQRAVRLHAGRSARRLRSISEQADGLWFVGHQLDQRPSRIASAQSSSRTRVSPDEAAYPSLKMR